MCGIGGILRTDGESIDEAWLEVIDARIAHRGPDGTGCFHDAAEVGGRTVHVALLHRRMSIIDLECGDQPMVSERGRHDGEGLVAVVFNGCIYNHRELRAELEGHGHTFLTDHSDTEVLLHGYREWGAELAEHLEGMYAFALWDRTGAALLLARDWFGEKPLYVRRGVGGNTGVTVFASDAAAAARVSAEDALPRPGDTAPLIWCDLYLQLGYNPQADTVYGAQGGDGVMSVPPTIWEKVDDLMPGRHRKPRETSQADFERLIEQAVARRLEADVPLGCFLSGGVDSSLIALFAKKHKPDLRTFSVRMPDQRYDESRFAEQVADHLGTDHTTLEVAINPARDLAHLVGLLGQPFGDSSILPTYWVSRAAREHVKVALSGDGGDELFLGYERFMAARHLARHRRLLRALPSGALLRAHPKSRRHKLGRLAAMARDLDALGVMAMESIFTQRQITELVGGLPERCAYEPLRLDPMQSLRRADLVSYLPNDLLLKVDTASMAVALEVRAPFLDRDLVRAALASPTWSLAAGGKRKGLLRNIARKHLPDAVVDRAKMGFAIPIGEWFRDDYGGLGGLLDLLRDPQAFGPIRLEPGAVEHLLDEHRSGRRDHGQRLFALVTLALWATGGGTNANVSTSTVPPASARRPGRRGSPCRRR